MTGPRFDPFYRLLSVERIGSTNDEAKRLAAAGAAEGTLVWSREQTAGRGRRGRLWASPPGNLYASLVLRPVTPLRDAAQLGFAAALATAEACAGFLPSGTEISLKWPNDVLIAGRKTAGLLLESQTAGDGGLAWLVLGIGVNLAAYPDGTEHPATSLAAAGAGEVAPGAVLEALAARLLAWYRRWQEDGFAPVRDAWLLRAHGLGREIRVRLTREELSGRFAGLDPDGALLLECAGGRRHIAAAEIFPAA